MIKNLVFDLGDTLMSYQYKDIDKILGVNDAENIAKKFFSSDDFVAFMSDYRTEEELLNTYTQSEDEKRVLQSVLSDIRWCVYYPKLYEWINSLQEQGFKIYLLSNYSMDMFYKHIQLIPIKFDGIVVSEDVHMCKPDRAIYELLLDRFNLKAVETIFFDDRIENLKEPRNMGFVTLSLQLDKSSGIIGTDFICN